MITRKDRDVGRLIDLLKSLKLEDNTIVFVTSDNGPHGEGGHDPAFFQSNGLLKGFKRDLYEGGIRIPLIVYWPDHIKPGYGHKCTNCFLGLYAYRQRTCRNPTSAKH